MSEQGSVSRWIEGVKAGDESAAERLWQRYYTQLVNLAHKHLNGAPRRRSDEEDVALQAFASFCLSARQDRFPRQLDRDDFWKLLLTITAHKALDEIEHDRADKRGGGRVRGDSAFRALETSSNRSGIGQVVGDEPTPEFAAAVAENCDRLLGLLDARLRHIVAAKLEGYTNCEIAARLGCAVSTIERGLRMIRSIWQQESRYE